MTQPTRTPNPATNTRPQRSSRRVARKKPLGILPWLLLGLLALLILGVVLAVLAVRGDDGQASLSGPSVPPVSAGAPSVDAPSVGAPSAGLPSAGAPSAVLPPVTGPSATVPSGSGPSAGSGAGGPGAGQPALRVGQQDLLALSGTPLTGAGVLGGPVTGSSVVTSVVSDHGFWVGDGARQVFVYLTRQARGGKAESPFQVKKGQTVQVTGDLTPLASDPEATNGVTDAEGLAQLKKQGAFVSATSISLG